VYGPGDKKLAQMINGIARWRVHVAVGRPDPPLAFIHVNDLVHLILAVAATGETLKPETDGPAAHGDGNSRSPSPTYKNLLDPLDESFATGQRAPDPDRSRSPAALRVTYRIFRRTRPSDANARGPYPAEPARPCI
jgi:nucleoside-diphosphate-sugar epimerase